MIYIVFESVSGSMQVIDSKVTTTPGILATTFNGSVSIDRTTISGSDRRGVDFRTLDHASLSISDSLIYGNGSIDRSFSGGGVFFAGIPGASGELRIINSTISGNIGDDGGGVNVFATEDATVVIVNTTIANNIATSNWGGLVIEGADHNVVSFQLDHFGKRRDQWSQ